MQRLEVSGALRPLKWPLGFKWLRARSDTSDTLNDPASKREFSDHAVSPKGRTGTVQKLGCNEAEVWGISIVS
jgi:hypothetical protein